MKIHIGTYFGIPAFLHWSWFLLIPFVLMTSGPVGLIFIVAAFFFVILHEYGHCLMALKLNLRVADVTLYPIGGLARMQIPIGRAKEELLIALAGPIVNFVIAFLTIGACSFLTVPEFTTFKELWANYPAYVILLAVVWINTMLFAFNMLPVFPMDGGRVLRSCLTMLLGDFMKATLIAVRTSQVLCMGLVFLGFYSGNFLFAVIFLFMMIGAQNELLVATYYTNIHTIKWKVGLVLGRPELALAPLSQVIEALEDVEDERIKELLKIDELLPVLKGVEGEA